MYKLYLVGKDTSIIASNALDVHVCLTSVGSLWKCSYLFLHNQKHSSTVDRKIALEHSGDVNHTQPFKL